MQVLYVSASFESVYETVFREEEIEKEKGKKEKQGEVKRREEKQFSSARKIVSK